jgi:propanol-preferring alcohol dehydrogenase
MKAMVVENWGERSKLHNAKVPSPGWGEALLKLRSAAVGLTILNMRTGSFGGVAPRIMGHELAGDIVEVGPGVTDLKPHDRCVAYFYLTCNRCRWCRGGRETLCENFGGFVGVHRDGGFADYVCLPAQNLLPIPEGLTYEAAAMATDAVNTNWHCMRERANINPHDTVMLIGAGGGLGIHGVQVAKLFGARVIATDVSDEKLALAKEWGADEIINVKRVADVAAEVKRLTNGNGVNSAIDYVGNANTFQAAYESLTTAGRAIVIGVGKGDISVNPRHMLLTEKVVTGSRHSTRAELIESLEVMARGLIKPVVGMRTHFTEIESIFDSIIDEKLLGRGAVFYDV